MGPSIRLKPDPTAYPNPGSRSLFAFAGQTKVLFTSVLAQMLFLTVCTVVVAGYITRMTKTILRAIQLMSREPPK